MSNDHGVRPKLMDRRSFTSAAASAAIASATGALMLPRGAGAEARASAGVGPVMELFTSQGCSSCPAADALFETYAKRDDVVALTLPVDYWDYLGWKDTLASAKFTKRQRGYAKHRGDGQIYTPQLVVNGLGHTNGGDVKAIEALIERSKAHAKSFTPIKVGTDNGHMVVEIGTVPKSERIEATVWAVSVVRRVDVLVKRGENAGKTLSYFNVVRDVHSIGTWTGVDPLTVRVAREAFAQRGEDAAAFVVQSGMAGPILGATMLHRL
jgi:hypothetical protein